MTRATAAVLAGIAAAALLAFGVASIAQDWTGGRRFTRRWHGKGSPARRT